MCFGLFSKSKLSSIDSPLFPILGNPQFEPGLRKGSFGALIDQGFFQASHFVTLGSWPTLQFMTAGSTPYQQNFWRAVQLRHFLNTLTSPSGYECNLTPFEEYCNGSGLLHQTLSKMYALLAAPLEGFQMLFFRKWEMDLN